ncbi:hypothetical protein HOF65_07430 [bacterium]|nr:hypothetical protein [bacterium]MBT3853745.1 hypothetical protein [bacterium]
MVFDIYCVDKFALFISVKIKLSGISSVGVAKANNENLSVLKLHFQSVIIHIQILLYVAHLSDDLNTAFLFPLY